MMTANITFLYLTETCNYEVLKTTLYVLILIWEMFIIIVE